MAAEANIRNLGNPVNAVDISINMVKACIDLSHPIVQKGIEMGLGYYGSPTLSDQTFIAAPSVKIGPGMSERSHTADEFVYEKEIEQGIVIYHNLLEEFLNN